MASFLPLKTGGWAFGEVLTSGQMNQLNTDFPFAANMRDGGAYTPSGSLTINDLVIPIAGGTLSYVGAISAATLAVTSGSTLGAITANGYVNLTAGGQVEDGWLVSGGLLTDSVTASGQLTAATIIGKAVSADVLGVDADHTYLLKSTESVIAPPLTAGRTYTIDTTGATNGMRISFTTNDGVHAITLVGPFAGGGTISLLATSPNKRILFTLIGGSLYIESQ